MNGLSVTRYGFVILICTSVAGCLGSGSDSSDMNGGGSGGGAGGGTGGGAGGGSGTVDTAYDTEFDRVTGLGPTQDMPTSLQASYTGQMMAEVTNADSIVGELVADLDIDVNWSDGQSSNAFSGGASNFQGRETGGSFEAIAGTLTVDSSLPSSIIRQELGGNIGGFDIPPTETGAMMVHLTGDLTQEQTVEATVMLGGNFFGPGASAASGAAVGGFNDPAAGGPAIFDGAIAGTYYLEAQ